MVTLWRTVKREPKEEIRMDRVLDGEKTSIMGYWTWQLFVEANGNTVSKSEWDLRMPPY